LLKHFILVIERSSYKWQEEQQSFQTGQSIIHSNCNEQLNQRPIKHYGFVIYGEWSVFEMI
jgi:hypothetical protein